jgi:hypothetical protein
MARVSLEEQHGSKLENKSARGKIPRNGRSPSKTVKPWSCLSITFQGWSGAIVTEVWPSFTLSDKGGVRPLSWPQVERVRGIRSGE